MTGSGATVGVVGRGIVAGSRVIVAIESEALVTTARLIAIVVKYCVTSL